MGKFEHLSRVFFFDFWTLTEIDFSPNSSKILKLTHQNFATNSQFRQIKDIYSTNSPEFIEIEV